MRRSLESLENTPAAFVGRRDSGTPQREVRVVEILGTVVVIRKHQCGGPRQSDPGSALSANPKLERVDANCRGNLSEAGVADHALRRMGTRNG